MDVDTDVIASIHIDVRMLTPEMVGNVDLIWASPVCKDYSRARTNAKTPRPSMGRFTRAGSARPGERTEVPDNVRESGIRVAET